ncbi:peptidase M61 [Cryomorphaceae bacterium]|nr:peptidase M61 [Cryomorphaceae bacterium]
MNRSVLLLLFLCVFSAYGTIAKTAEPVGYKVSFDLNHLVEDRLTITMETPQVHTDEIEFQMPKIVPGTYGISDFGRFVSSFSALDTNGQPLPVKQIGTNRWGISGAQGLGTLSYQIDDTFDGEPGKTVFEPGGSNFQADTNFVLNLFAMVGYLEGIEDRPFELTIAHPSELYGVTALEVVDRSADRDRFMASDYFTMHDSPIMYSAPDTASVQVANARIEVMVYSPNGQLNAREVMDRNKDLFAAAAEYLGGTLPVDRYAQLIYLWDGPTNSGGMGALEHSYSTVFSLPDLPDSVMGQEIQDVTAHEFFHIVTPLTIHSEEIHDYNWIEPQMSEHLWLYEGVTEYSAHHMQVKAGLISEQEFLETMQEKMTQSTTAYDDQVPFTTMSAHCLDVYAGEYGNVYQKGALIGMALDLQLLHWSEGAYGLQSLIKDLQDRYGAEKAFKDEELFDAIAELTYPEIREFFTRHLESYEALPFEEVLNYAGVSYQASVPSTTITFGKIPLGYNPNTGRLFIASLDDANDFAANMGYQVGDEFISINEFDLTNVQMVGSQIDAWRASTSEGDKVKIVVARKSGEEFENVVLKGKAMEVETSDDHVVQFVTEPTPEQQRIRDHWLKDKKG